jgi:hypothetical protein
MCAIQNNKNIINTQPVVSYFEQPSIQIKHNNPKDNLKDNPKDNPKDNHKNNCCTPNTSEKRCFETSLSEWIGNFRVHCSVNDDGCTMGFICFPITCPLRSLCLLPCASYNECCNKTNNTKNLNYLCC